MLYVDKAGRVFTVELSMTNEIFQKLNTLPKNRIKNLYYNLIKEKCRVFKDIEFRNPNMDSEFDMSLSRYVCGSIGSGKEYVTINLKWRTYNQYGTQNYIKLQKMFEEGTLEKLIEERKTEKTPSE